MRRPYLKEKHAPILGRCTNSFWDEMRPKRRYIAFEVVGKASKNQIARAIESSLRDDRDKIMKLILYEARSGRGLLRCGHLQVLEAKAAMSSIERIGGEKVSLGILGISGTIRAAKRKFLPSSTKVL